MQTWIVIGSSPRVIEAYAIARQRWPNARTITTNKGLSVEPDPDYYFLFDLEGCQLWSREARQAAQRGKTKTVTLKRDPDALKALTVDDFDIFVEEGPPYEPFQISGLWCLEFAIRYGSASHVVMVGMDGYSPTVGPSDYFDGSQRPPDDMARGRNHLINIVIPRTNTLVRKYPEVQFLCVGRPHYQIDQPNWRIVSLDDGGPRDANAAGEQRP